MKMSAVDVPQLFAALTLASRPMTNGFPQVEMGFVSGGGSKPSDDSTIWYFFLHGQREAPTTCRFFSVAPYLDAGMTVDDITTAIQTGWKMSGGHKSGSMSFHKETKLLIVVGTDFQLRMVAEALQALPSKNSKVPDASPKSAGK
jgi:hypothetical protein